MHPFLTVSLIAHLCFTGGSNGNPATLGGSSLPAAGPPVERKNSSSGVWTVTDVDQHNPSVNSDNSTGSTSGSWVIKPASGNTPPPPPPKTNGHSSIQSPVKKSLTPHTNGSKGPDLSRSDGYEQIAQVMIFVTNTLIYLRIFHLNFQ